MSGRRYEKLTTAALNRMAKEPPAGDVWDTEIPGYHVRPRSGWLALRYYYRGLDRRGRILTLGRYGVLTAAQAREHARQAAATVAQGGDPREDEAQARAEAVRSLTRTVGAYLEDSYRQYQETHKRDGKATGDRIRRQFASLLSRPMNSLTRDDVVQWQAEQLAQGLAFSTLRRSYGALCTMLNRAVVEGLIDSNPLAGIHLERPAVTTAQLATAGGERRFLEPAEIEALFVSLDLYQERKRAKRRSSRSHGKRYLVDFDAVAFVDFVPVFVLTMLRTGLRPSDLFGLRWEHLSFKRRQIRKVIEKTAHQKSDPQTFPLSTDAVHVLAEWHEQQGKPGEGYVFAGRFGERLSSSAMRKPWRLLKALSAEHVAVEGGAPLPDVDLYTLRHHYASALLLSGADLLTVSRLMGHSSIDVTVRNYGHLAVDHSRKVVERYSAGLHSHRKSSNIDTSSAA